MRLPVRSALRPLRRPRRTAHRRRRGRVHSLLRDVPAAAHDPERAAIHPRWAALPGREDWCKFDPEPALFAARRSLEPRLYRDPHRRPSASKARRSPGASGSTIHPVRGARAGLRATAGCGSARASGAGWTRSDEGRGLDSRSRSARGAGWNPTYALLTAVDVTPTTSVAFAVHRNHYTPHNYSKEFYVDTAANQHVTNDKSWFDTFHENRTDFSIVGSDPSTSYGTGTVLFYPTEVSSGRPICVTLTDVHYMPDNPFNLISHSRLKASGFIVDFHDLLISWNDFTFNLYEQNGLYPWPEQLSSSTSMASSQFVSAGISKTGRNTDDWQFIKSEFTALNERYGPFDTELFRNANNALLDTGYDESDNAFRHLWASSCFYGNPVYEERFIHLMFEKALTDFKVDPKNTKFMFIVPKWDNSSWWHYTKYFTLAKEYPKGSVIFTAPKAGTYRTHLLKEAGEEGGADRVFIQGTSWPVCVFYKDVFSFSLPSNSMTTFYFICDLAIQVVLWLSP